MHELIREYNYFNLPQYFQLIIVSFLPDMHDSFSVF